MADIHRDGTHSSQRKPEDYAANALPKRRETWDRITWVHTERKEVDMNSAETVTRYEQGLILMHYPVDDPIDDLNKSCKRLGQSIAGTLVS